MADIQSTIDDLIHFSINLEPESLDMGHIAALRHMMELLEYHLKYGGRGATPIVDEKPKTMSKNLKIHCSVQGCVDGLPLWNIKAGAANGVTDWRCLHHIPKEMTFPISLWGEEWEATGREPPAWKKKKEPSPPTPTD